VFRKEYFTRVAGGGGRKIGLLFVGEGVKAGIKKRGIKQKYLKLSSFWKEEYPKGEVVGDNIKC
jgi:hypothetical protein